MMRSISKCAACMALLLGAGLPACWAQKWEVGVLGGGLRYEYLPGDLKVSSGGAESTFSGEAHAIHYDFLMHFAPTGSKIRPFVAAGGGVKVYRGTGAATLTQPLQRFALLTAT